jgi:hypothetical protein
MTYKSILGRMDATIDNTTGFGITADVLSARMIDRRHALSYK